MLHFDTDDTGTGSWSEPLKSSVRELLKLHICRIIDIFRRC